MTAQAHLIGRQPNEIQGEPVSRGFVTTLCGKTLSFPTFEAAYHDDMCPACLAKRADPATSRPLYPVWP